MSDKKQKKPRSEKLSISLSEQEKSFLKAYREKFNEKYQVKFSYGDIILHLCDEKATKQKIRPFLKQLSLFEKKDPESF